ncbi:MAG: bifunctional folylpolyglutamate synthase/dihydrofolate synthase [Gammaproteobacteria bacterium]|nr:bifunctional folylpolyglutamate synthase/dihydrofolate synthase [Gammaproteobacteria bacterium]
MTLDDWLARLERLHPQEMDLGLERLQQVFAHLGGRRPAPKVITVAGTNGKGSVVATLDAVLRAHGLKVGVTTSPHLHRFNERIVIAGREAGDGAIIEAFERIDEVRGSISLTYFEFAILAAFELMADADLDVAVLEVGLGGRLDAVNIIDADVTVISSVDLDHEAWLGSDRETIGREKAGILRQGRPLVIGETQPPRSVLDHARGLEVPVYRAGQDFHWQETDSGATFRGGPQQQVELVGLPASQLLPANLAAGLQAASLLLELVPARVHDALAGLSLPGRAQRRRALGCDWILDVAHNPHALAALVAQIGTERRWVAVFGTFRDKRADRMLELLESRVAALHLAPTPGSRGQSAAELAGRLAAVAPTLPRREHDDVAGALTAAHADACAGGFGVLVAGSFTLVAAADRWLEAGCRGAVAS